MDKNVDTEFFWQSSGQVSEAERACSENVKPQIFRNSRQVQERINLKLELFEHSIWLEPRTIKVGEAWVKIMISWFPERAGLLCEKKVLYFPWT